MVTLRTAQLRDMPFVRRVRNEANSRRWSADIRKVSVPRHVLWWLSRARANELVYVVMLNDSRAGYARVKMERRLAEISIALTQSTRGQGAGSEAIRQVVRRTEDLPHLDGWRARIDPKNLPSIRAFESAGFLPSAELNDVEEPWLILERRRF